MKFLDRYDEHAAEGSLAEGEAFTAALLDRLRRSPAWPRMAVIVTYDDYGGWYDHVPPTPVDPFGPGNRVPCLILSPWARKGFVDHTPYETVSILRFLCWRFGLEPLTHRDRQAHNLLPAFDFDQPPTP